MNPKHFLLSESDSSGRVRFLAGLVTLPVSDKNTSWVTVTRAGSFTDPRYGRFDITQDMMMSMVRNFESRTLGVDVFLDVSHKPADGAAAKILKLSVDGSRLRALVEWTPYGIEAVKKRGFIYLSAEFTENYQDNEAGAFHGPLLLGAGLTVRPVIKHLDPVTLSCASDEDHTRFYIHPEIVKKILSEDTLIMNKHLKTLLEALSARQLAEPVIANIKQLAEDTLKNTSDEAAQIALCQSLEQAAVKLAEAMSTLPAGSAAPVINLSITGTGLNADAVNEQVVKALTEAQAGAKKLAETQGANIKQLSELIHADKGLDEDLKKQLSESAASLITAEMTEESIKALAQLQINQGNQILAARQLSRMGYGPVGSPHITVPDEGVKKLSGIYREHLGKTNYAGRLHLDEKAPLHPFCERILSEFDRIHGYSIHSEVKTLAEGATNMGSTHLPVGFQREVIREALSDLNVLQLVQTLTDFAAQATTQIPYEQRDVSQVMAEGVVFEGQQIPFAGVTQAMDTAYITPMKLALKITNEVIHFTRASAINWDAMARNIESNARFLRELVARRICNELQRAADSYLAQSIENEVITSQLGSKHTIKTEKFPIVRPFQAKDLSGKLVGLAENPISITLNSVMIPAFDGSGTQPAGTYFRVLSFNLGVIQFVNQNGAPTAPAATGTNTISYSAATNLVKFNLDLPAGIKQGEHYNGLIAAVGSRKAMMNSQRYVTPDFQLMSASLNDTASNADQFINLLKREGSHTDSAGDLAAIKAIPAYGTNAPGIDLGDERILLGQKNLGAYVIAKPFATSEPIEVMQNGHPVGQKVCYGEEYNSIHVPKPVRNRLTSVIAYSKAARDSI